MSRRQPLPVNAPRGTFFVSLALIAGLFAAE